MADTTHKPVIFLAFANDRDDTVGYLRNLPEEARRLREVLGPAVQAGLCEVEVRSNCTAGDIFKVFQDPRYRNRVAIFHYGGHANGFQLLLESAEGQSASADAGGLAAFLAQQQGLQLVFLNGCSTQSQTQGLLDANISVVLSTSRAIDDKVATDFSSQFYQGLASGATIRTAYHEAAASLQMAHGNNMRGLYFGAKDRAQSQPEADRWPWNLYLREGSESADQWNLPEAVNDPLFGLPPLPKQDLPESPYRHLNWFTRKDAEVFFGRGHQIRELYDRLTAPHAAPIILFYGQSGVGKSSVLDAGLIPRLEQAYEVRYLRRAAGGLLNTLQRAFLPEADDVPLEIAWQMKEEKLHKPLIVFLDQVEELYTRPIADMPDELDQLLRGVKAIFGDVTRRPQGKLVFSFRKEWLAELEAQLAAYELPRTKIFLATLDRRGIIEVVRGPSRSTRLHERYGLTVEDGLAEIIADDLLEDRDSAIAPTLQILLTKMWAKATEVNYEHPQFNQELYQQLKRDGILLRDFLNQQIAAFRERYPEAVDSGLLLDIVALHTTPLGTADQCSVEELQQQYAHLGATLPAILQQCQDLHLLTVAASAQKESVKTTRLAHDTLAPLVREQFDQSDKPGQRARRILDNRSVDWAVNQSGTPLDEADLKVVEHGIDGTRVWNSTEQRLVHASRELRIRLQRTRKILKVVGALAVTVITVLGVFGWSSYTEVGRKNEALVGKTEEANKKTKEAEYEKAKAVAASKVADERRREAERQEQIANAQRLAVQSSSLIRTYPQRSLLLAVESLKSTPIPIPEAVDSLRSGLESIQGQALLGMHNYSACKVAFAPDGKWAAVAANDGTALVWNLHNLDKPPTILQPDPGGTEVGYAAGFARSLQFSTNGKWLFVGHGNKRKGSKDDTAIRVWELGERMSSTTPRFVLQGHVGAVSNIAVSTDGARLASSSWLDPKIYIWNLNSPDPSQDFRVLHGHTNGVSSITFSSDGIFLISAGRDGTTRIWNLETQDPNPHCLVLTGHKNRVGCVAISPGDEWLATAGGDRWNMDDEREVDFTVQLRRFNSADDDSTRIILDGHMGSIECLTFTPDRKWLISGSDDRTVRLWDIQAVSRVEPLAPLVLTEHSGDLNTIRVSPDGKWLATACDDMSCRIWNLETIRESRAPTILSGHEGSINDVCFSHNGNRLLTGGGGSFGEVRLWNIPPSSRQPVFALRDTMAIDEVRFGIGDQWLITQGAVDHDKRSAKLWNLMTDSSTITPTDLMTPKQYEKAYCSPDGRWVVTHVDVDDKSAPKQAMLWCLSENGAEPKQTRVAVDDFSYSGVADFTKDGRFLFMGSFGKKALISNLQHEDPTKYLKSFPSGYEDTRSFGHFSFGRFSPSGQSLITGLNENILGRATLWMMSLEDAPRPIILDPPLVTTEETLTQCRSFIFSPDGRWLATESFAGLVSLWDLTKHEQQSKPFSPEVVVKVIETEQPGIAFAANGKWFAVRSSKYGFTLWKVLPDGLSSEKFFCGHRDDEIDEQVDGIGKTVYEIVFVIQDRWCLSHTWDALYLWDLESADPSQRPIVLRCPENMSHYQIKVSSDGRWLLTIPRQPAECLLWDLRSNLRKAHPFILRGHARDRITVATFDRNGRWLATGDGGEYSKDSRENSTVKLWDLRAVNPQHASYVMSGHPANITSLEFSCDGNRLASASLDGTLLIWDLNTNRLVDIAQRGSGRNFTWDEWDTYFPNVEYRRTFQELPEHPSVLAHFTSTHFNSAKASVDIGDMQAAELSFEKATTWVVKTDDPDLCNSVCWVGSLAGFASEVLSSGERAVELAPSNYSYRDTRGVARAIMGDLNGALEDFESFVNSRPEKSPSMDLRREWIEALRAGKQPITKEVREFLRKNEQ